MEHRRCESGQEKNVLFILIYRSGVFQDKSDSSHYQNHQQYFFQNKYAKKRLLLFYNTDQKSREKSRENVVDKEWMTN